jgi:hypothetical protein
LRKKFVSAPSLASVKLKFPELILFLTLLYHEREFLMFPATRTRKSIAEHILVIAIVICLFTFAIYLKAGSNYPGNNSPSQTRIWADPNQRPETHTKIAPITLVLLPSLVLLVRRMEEPRSYSKLPDPPCEELFFRSKHWFRPPPATA